jgi:hypothetical protein
MTLYCVYDSETSSWGWSESSVGDDPTPPKPPPSSLPRGDACAGVCYCAATYSFDCSGDCSDLDITLGCRRYNCDYAGDSYYTGAGSSASCLGRGDALLGWYSFRYLEGDKVGIEFLCLPLVGASITDTWTISGSAEHNCGSGYVVGVSCDSGDCYTSSSYTITCARVSWGTAPTEPPDPPGPTNPPTPPPDTPTPPDDFDVSETVRLGSRTGSGCNSIVEICGIYKDAPKYHLVECKGSWTVDPCAWTSSCSTKWETPIDDGKETTCTADCGGSAEPPSNPPSLPSGMVCYDEDNTPPNIGWEFHDSYHTTSWTVSSKNGAMRDSCDGDSIYEMRCSEDGYRVNHGAYPCPNGCYEGACIK